MNQVKERERVGDVEEVIRSLERAFEQDSKCSMILMDLQNQVIQA